MQNIKISNKNTSAHIASKDKTRSLSPPKKLGVAKKINTESTSHTKNTRHQNRLRTQDYKTGHKQETPGHKTQTKPKPKQPT